MLWLRWRGLLLPLPLLLLYLAAASSASLGVLLLSRLFCFAPPLLPHALTHPLFYTGWPACDTWL